MVTILIIYLNKKYIYICKYSHYYIIIMSSNYIKFSYRLNLKKKLNKLKHDVLMKGRDIRTKQKISLVN